MDEALSIPPKLQLLVKNKISPKHLFFTYVYEFIVNRTRHFFIRRLTSKCTLSLDLNNLDYCKRFSSQFYSYKIQFNQF